MFQDRFDDLQGLLGEGSPGGVLNEAEELGQVDLPHLLDLDGEVGVPVGFGVLASHRDGLLLVVDLADVPGVVEALLAVIAPARLPASLLSAGLDYHLLLLGSHFFGSWLAALFLHPGQCALCRYIIHRVQDDMF